MTLIKCSKIPRLNQMFLRCKFFYIPFASPILLPVVAMLVKILCYPSFINTEAAKTSQQNDRNFSKHLSLSSRYICVPPPLSCDTLIWVCCSFLFECSGIVTRKDVLKFVVNVSQSDENHRRYYPVLSRNSLGLAWKKKIIANC